MDIAMASVQIPAMLFRVQGPFFGMLCALYIHVCVELTRQWGLAFSVSAALSPLQDLAASTGYEPRALDTAVSPHSAVSCTVAFFAAPSSIHCTNSVAPEDQASLHIGHITHKVALPSHALIAPSSLFL